ncbi:zinc ABC transporter substrate-binding protein [Auraticoccus sp. F435]|uniref:Zinc ABC transporter substrate-binding protein n=1 Tax=Auraticoccus cholistanensis TaxID=2656650 RepID=A0A6A9V1Q6_9ACTN|nr:zinc ABC transporter substrate-binding protein [Auraticoccus cholistanensis]MVA77517.1 zinc ABC transporter substrate-binding protein [Auraticoccus cholistanensis]
MSLSRRLSLCALALPVLLTATACGGGAAPAGDGDGLKVVTAFYPFQFVAERVAGDQATVTSLTAPGAEPHDLELSPRQLIELAEADLVVYQSGFQPAVDEAIAQNPPADVVDVAELVTLRTIGEEEATAEEHGHEHGAEEEHAHEHAEEGHAEEGHAEEEHAEEEHGAEEGHEGHDHSAEAGSTDPHSWLDPTTMVAVTDVVADRLATAQPESAGEVEAAAAQLVAELEDLDQDFQTGLQSCERQEFITTHAAFGYLADRYGLTQIAISGISPDAEPSPARIAEIHAEAKAHQVTTIFTETLTSPAVAEAVAGDLGLRTDVLDPLEGLTEQSRGSDYIAVQRANLEALRTANGCS